MKTLLLILFFTLSLFRLFAQADDKYDQLIVNAGSSLKAGQLDEAQQAVQQAIQLNATNYLAYAVAAKIASKEGNTDQANNLVQKALELAPDDQKDKVRELAQQVQSASLPSSPTPSDQLSDQDRLTLNELMVLLDQADQATTPEDRQKAFSDFLDRSADFVKAHPDQTNIWMMRAFAAIDLNRPHDAWEAGQHLKTLEQMHSDDPKMGKVLAELDLKGWLNSEPTSPPSSSVNIGDEVGDMAPAFQGIDQNGNVVKSSDIIGKKIVLLYFYPKDFTGGCTKEACGFRDLMGDLQKDNVEVIGVSFDTAASHQAFVAKYNLNFTLLSDPDGQIADAYGTRILGRNMARRISFLIGLDGKIVHVTNSGNPQVHFDEMKAAIESLQEPM